MPISSHPMGHAAARRVEDRHADLVVAFAHAGVETEIDLDVVGRDVADSICGAVTCIRAVGDPSTVSSNSTAVSGAMPATQPVAVANPAAVEKTDSSRRPLAWRSGPVRAVVRRVG